MTADPRGPVRAIVRVEPLARDDSGTFRPVALDCGHVARLNATFSYREGERAHCYACRREALAAEAEQ